MLIVEDERKLRELVRSCLEPPGFTVRAGRFWYFPTSQSLLADAAMEVVAPDVDRAVTEGHFAGVDPADAAGLMDAAVRTMAELMFKEEAAFRNVVRATVDRWLAEQGRPRPDPDAIRQTRGSNGSTTRSARSATGCHPTSCAGSLRAHPRVRRRSHHRPARRMPAPSRGGNRDHALGRHHPHPEPGAC